MGGLARINKWVAFLLKIKKLKKVDTKYTTLTQIRSGLVNKPSVQNIARTAETLGVLIGDLGKNS